MAEAPFEKPDANIGNTDTRIVDAIAVLLGTSSDWDVEFLEIIADTIGKARPHPGNAGDGAEYLKHFAEEKGFDARDSTWLSEFIVEDEDDDN